MKNILFIFGIFFAAAPKFLRIFWLSKSLVLWEQKKLARL